MKKKSESTTEAKAPTSSVANARKALQMLKEKEVTNSEYENYVATMLKEKMEAGLTKEQSMEVIKAQIENDAGLAAAV